jgi:NADPH:quinone reductase
MKAAWYEKQGAARDVLVVGNMDDPQPSADEVRIRIAFSGVNPGDVKKREDAFRVGMPYPHRRASSTRSSKHFRQAHLKFSSLGIAKWPHLPQTNRPSAMATSGLNSSPETQ